jgi:hypothetical protein
MRAALEEAEVDAAASHQHAGLQELARPWWRSEASGCGGRADELGWAERPLPTDPRRQASGRNPIRGEERYARA